MRNVCRFGQSARSFAPSTKKNITASAMSSLTSCWPYLVIGASAPAALALDLAKIGGRIVLAGGGRDEPVENFYIGKIVMKELTIRGVFGREIATVLPALRLMESGKYPLELLSTHTYPLKDAERALLTVGNEGDEGAIHVTIVNE